MFPYAKTQSYILPIKADVRKKENIFVGKMLEIGLAINV